MKRRTDIAIFGLNYPPEHAGIGPYTGALASGLRRMGYRVAAHVAHPHYPQWKIRSGYGQLTRVDDINGVEVHRRLHYVPRSPRGVRRLLSELTFGVRILCAPWQQPRLVIGVSPPLFSLALIAMRLRLNPRRPRLVLWLQDLYSLGLSETGEGGRIASTITTKVERSTVRAADDVVVIHERFARFVVETFGIDPRRVTVIRNWTHLPQGKPIHAAQAKAEFGWPSDITTAVHTGNMGAKQGLENIIEAARLADGCAAPVHFFLIGDGGERPKLQERAAGVSRVTFLPPLSEDKYRHALAGADVLLVNEKPGVSAMAVPSKLTSYFDAGRPVVAAADPEGITASEIRAAQAGIVVSPCDPLALLDAVLQIRRDTDAAHRYGCNGQRYRKALLDESTALKQWNDLIASTSSPDA